MHGSRASLVCAPKTGGPLMRQVLFGSVGRPGSAVQHLGYRVKRYSVGFAAECGKCVYLLSCLTPCDYSSVMQHDFLW